MTQTSPATTKTMKAVYPGSFDPVTKGHLDIIQRASRIVDKLVILVSNNPDKKCKLRVEERLSLIKDQVSDFVHVEVQAFTGLIVDYVKENDYDVILRSIRCASDFEAELEMSQINKNLSNYDTMFLMTRPENSFIRSSRVWELMALGAGISDMVPETVEKYLLESR